MCNQNIEKCENADGENSKTCAVFKYSCKLRNRIQEVINGHMSVEKYLLEDIFSHLIPLFILLKANPEKWENWGLSKQGICQLVQAFYQLGDGVIGSHFLDEIRKHFRWFDCSPVSVSNPQALINGVLTDVTCCLERRNPQLFNLELDQCSNNNACKNS
jgi:hypothetical protein